MAALPDDYVYLDWAATAPLCEEAAAAMEPYMVPGPRNLAANGNANSLHSVGRAAFTGMEDARMAVSRALHADRPTDIVFTSGATEADNLALLGITHALLHERRGAGKPAGGTVITTTIEHDAVLSVLPLLREMGVTVVQLAPDRGGFISVDALKTALAEADDPLLVSVMLANNEMGAVQDVRALAAAAHQAGALFHTDATQALGKVPIDLRELGVDAASFSAHKICGPKGIGALYLKAHTPVDALVRGGGQEGGLRSGTQNVAGMAGFGAACKAAVDAQPAEAARERALRDRLYADLSQVAGVKPVVDVPAGSDRYLPNIADVTVDGMESETLILRLDIAGFAVSGGSACSTGSLDPSHVLTALGIPRDRALGALRVSFGRYTTEDDIERFIAAFKQAVGR
jgi:cysteine desulfurase